MPKKHAGVSGDVLANAVFKDGLDIPDFLKLTPEQRAAARERAVMVEIKDTEEEIDPVEAELRADVRRMLAPHGVLCDDVTRALYLATKRGNKRHTSPASPATTTTTTASAERQAGIEKRRRERFEKEATRARRPSKDGKITVIQIASELGITGNVARTALRSLKMKKPEGGWAFDPSEASAIKEKIKSCVSTKTTGVATRETQSSSAASGERSDRRLSPAKKAKTTKRRGKSSKRR